MVNNAKVSFNLRSQVNVRVGRVGYTKNPSTCARDKSKPAPTLVGAGEFFGRITNTVTYYS